MILNWISFNFEVEYVLIVWFFMFLAVFKFNLGYYLRNILRIKQTQPVKILDCFPCQSFWVALLTTFNPLVAIAVYCLAVLTDKK